MPNPKFCTYCGRKLKVTASLTLECPRYYNWMGDSDRRHTFKFINKDEISYYDPTTGERKD